MSCQQNSCEDRWVVVLLPLQSSFESSDRGVIQPYLQHCRVNWIQAFSVEAVLIRKIDIKRMCNR